MPQSLAEFGRTVKEKHPEYGDMPDEVIGQKVIDKYPQYADMVSMPITANPKGEGVYKMVGPDGKAVGIPYSNVQTARGQKYNFTDDGEVSRWRKDSQAGMSLLDKAKDNFKWNTRDVPGNGADTGGSAIGAALQNFGGTVAQDIAQPIAHPWDTVKGVARTAGNLVLHSGQFDPENPINQIAANAVQSLKDDPRKALAQGAGHAAAAYLTDKVPAIAGGAVGEAANATNTARAAAKNSVARAVAGGALDEVIPGDTVTPRQVYETAKGMGVNLDLAQATGGKVANTVKKASEHSLLGSGDFEKLKAANREALDQHAVSYLDQTAPPMAREDFGRMVQGKLAEHQQEMNDAAGEIYKSLDQKFGPEKQVTQGVKEEAQNIVRDYKGYYDKNPTALYGGTRRAWDFINDMATSKTPATWTDLHRLRSDLMDLTRGPEMVADRGIGWLKSMTGKIDEAMTSPSAMDANSLQQFRDANEIYSKMKGAFDNPQSQLFHIVRAPDGLTAANQILGMKPADMRFLQDAAPDAITQVQRQAMSKILSPAGNAAPEWSTLPTRFNRVQKEALRGVLSDEQVQKLEDLSRVSRIVNDDSNRSGTAKVAIPAAEIATASGGLKSAALGVISGDPIRTIEGAATASYPLVNKQIAKTITSPKFVERVMDASSKGPGKWASTGELKLTEHLHANPSSGLTLSDIKELAKTPKGRSVLFRASDLTPGSKAMKALIAEATQSLDRSR